MKEYILDTFKIGMSEKEAEKYFSKEIKKMNITERKIYLKNERKYLKFFKILLKRNRKFIIKIREYFEYEISNLFKKEQKILKKEIININKFNFKFKNMHLKNRKYLEIFLKISYSVFFLRLLIKHNWKHLYFQPLLLYQTIHKFFFLWLFQ